MRSRNIGARLEALERATSDLAQRLAAFEDQTGAARAPAWPDPVAASVVAAPPPAAAGDGEPPPAAPAVPVRPSLEDLLGGRVLAWSGGLAVVVGVALLLAIAVANGWIGEGARTAMAGVLSIALIAVGTWLQERRRRSDAALATVAAGVAALFVTIAVGSAVYAIVPAAAGLALALLAGALAATLAIRWDARGIAALGIVGALLAPVLAGAAPSATTLALLWLAGAAAACVLVWQRWNWLAVAVFAVALAQWAWWLGLGQPDGAALLVLAAFGLLNVAAAIGFELRVPTAALRPSSALLLTLNALVVALSGWWSFAGSTLAPAWLVALAGLHLSVGLATRTTRISPDVRLLVLAIGVVLADVAAGLILDGPVLAIAWAAATAGFALLARRVVVRGDAASAHAELLAGAGLGGHLLLSAVQAIAQAPPGLLAGGGAATLGGGLAIAATAACAFVAGRLAAQVRPRWRTALDAAAMAGVAYLTVLTLDGALLAAALAGQALALGTIAARIRDDVATAGAGAFLALALGHALVFEAPPGALATGLRSIPDAGLALGAVALAALRGAWLTARARTALGAVGALALLYLASAVLVTAVGGGDLGQSLLSGLWAATGLTALVIGLAGDRRALRLGSLALLLTTIAKVFAYDLAALESLYRVGSFIALGLLLLVGAGLWQRMRPRPPADLRAAPRGLS